MPTTAEPVEIPQPSGVLFGPWSFRKLSCLLATFGPAAIVASVAIGAGETIVVVQAGAWAGYSLLWLLLLAVFAKGVCVTYLLGRYTAVSGELISQRLVRLPGPRGWLLLTIVALELAAAGPLWAAILRPCGNLVYFLFLQIVPSAIESLSISPQQATATLSTVILVGILLMSLRLTYEKLERQQVVICAVLVTGTAIGTALVQPSIWKILAGFMNFGGLPRELPEWAPDDARSQPLLTMAITFGYVGGTVMGYAAYANWIGLHGWGLSGHPQIEKIRQQAAESSPAAYLPTDNQSVQRLRRSLLPLRWDVAMGAFVLFIVAASFMVAGAAVLYPLLSQGKIEAFVGWSLLTDQAYIWRQIHPWLVWIYYLCVLAALWGTLHAFPEIYSRVTTDYFSAVWPQRQWSFTAIQRAICCYVLLATVPLLWVTVPFSTLTAITAFLATNLAVALISGAALYLNFQLPSEYRTRWWMLSAGVLATVLLIVATCVSGYGLWYRLATL